MNKLTLIFLLGACASKPYLESSTPPDWMASMPKYCKNEYICGVGEGSSLAQADDRSKSDILKTIKSSVDSSVSYSEKSDGNTLSSSAMTETSLHSSGELKSVELIERWKKEEGNYFSFSRVKKSLLLSEIDSELSPLLKEQKFQFRKNTFGSLLKAKSMEKNIAPLIFEYEGIQGSKYSRHPEMRQIIKRLNFLRRTPIDLQISVQAGSHSFVLKSLIRALFVRNGLNLSSTGKALRISAEFKSIPVNSKVKGFVQKKAELNITSRSSTNESELQFSRVVSGRSDSQVNERIKFEIKRFLEDNMSDLINL